MTDIKRYDKELELSWEMPREEFLKICQEGKLRKIDTLQIEQKWCFKNIVQNVGHSVRVRKTIQQHGIGAIIRCEYTTKYYFSATDRMELNVNITPEEYTTIFDLYPDGKVVNKTRLLLVDRINPNPVGVLYAVDFLKENPDTVIVEVEFSTLNQKKEFVLPDWAKPYVKGGA